MFKDLPEGQTHSFADGCKPPHKKPPAGEKDHICAKQQIGDRYECLRCMYPFTPPSQEKPEWGMNDFLDQSAKRFDASYIVGDFGNTYEAGDKVPLAAFKSFLRSEMLQSMRVILDRVEAGESITSLRTELDNLMDYANGREN